ncbi:MAG: secretin N-terminal domain-containing protein [Planctomycetota bacterium]
MACGRPAGRQGLIIDVGSVAKLRIVTAPAEIHQQIETICKTIDKPVGDGQSPIRFYKLENANAVDVIATLQTIEGDSGLGDVSVDGIAGEPKAPAEKDRVFTGLTESQVNGPDNIKGLGADTHARAKANRVNGHGARIMADEASNMIIIVAKPAMHAVYEKLIKRLDLRRPQVLVEATVIAVDTTDDFSLGVEIGKGTKVDDGKGKLLTFSSFGLSEVDKSSGALTLKPGVGFNGVLLGADIANIVVQALASDSRAKVISRPSMLINDNAKATLVSENEEPYASLNASSTVATTSFAGYSSAGTNIVIKPQISDGEHLKLQYEITLSSFGAARSDTLPPARQKNMLTSEVAIPDGHTIVVGGLTRENMSKKVDRIPWLGDVPGLEYMVSNRSQMGRKSTLFVFIRAVILRDDKFKDLKLLSRDATARAELPGDFPLSEPREIPWRGRGVRP